MYSGKLKRMGGRGDIGSHMQGTVEVDNRVMDRLERTEQREFGKPFGSGK